MILIGNIIVLYPFRSGIEMATSQRQDIDLGIVRYEYGESARARRAVLQIKTAKYYNGGLISDASVYWVGDHSRQNMISFGNDQDGDYSKRLLISARTVKATQKAVDTQHAQVFTAEVIADLTKAAKASYAARVKAGKDGMGNVYPADTQTVPLTGGSVICDAPVTL